MFNSALTPSQKLTLLALAEFADKDGGSCRPGIEGLTKLTSQSEKTCRRALDVTEAAWFTRTAEKFAGREWRGYRYELRMPEGADTVTASGREAADTVTGPQPNGADTVTAAQGVRCGHLSAEVRSLTPRGAVTVTDDLGRAPRKSTQEKPRARETTFRDWSNSVSQDRDDLISPEDPIFEWAEDAGISRDFLYIAWRWFCQRYDGDPKTYRDWRAVFRRCVREDWHRCWRTNRQTEALELTTVGLQIDRLLRIEAKREEAA